MIDQGTEIHPGYVIRYPGDVCNSPAEMEVTRCYVNRWGAFFDAVETEESVKRFGNGKEARTFKGEHFGHFGDAPHNWRIVKTVPSKLPTPKGNMTFRLIYEEQRPSGFYFATDNGADVAGVEVIAPRCRKPKYIATASVKSIESIQQRIERHENPMPRPALGVQVDLTKLH